MTRADRLTLLGAVALGLGLRVVCAGRTLVIQRDGTRLLELGQDLLTGGFHRILDHVQHPLATVLFGLAQQVAGSAGDPMAAVLAGQVVDVALGTLTIAAVWWICREMLGPAAAAVGAVLIATQPYLVRYSADVLTEPAYLLLVALSLALGLHALRTGSIRSQVALGASGALAYLTRPEALITLAVIALFLLLRLLSRRGERRRRLAGAVLGAMLFVSLAGPYVVYISDLHARRWGVPFQLSSLKLTPKKTASDWETRYVCERKFAERIAADLAAGTAELPASGPHREGPVAYLLFKGLDGLFWPYLALLAVALVSWPLRRWWKAAVPRAPPLATALLLVNVAGLAAVFVWLASTQGYLAKRHMLQLSLPLAPFAAGGALVLSAAVASWLPARQGRWVLPLLVTVLAAVNLPKALEPQGEDKIQLRKAGEYILQQSGPGQRVLGTQPRASFYARGVPCKLEEPEAWLLPRERDELLVEMVEVVWRPDYVVVDRSHLFLVERFVPPALPLAPARFRLERATLIPALRPRDDVLVFRVVR